MAVLVNRSYVHATGNLATDLARYGSSAQWRGVYYRGEKSGFTVSQTVPIDGRRGARRRRLRAAGRRTAADGAARRAHDHHAAHDREREPGVRAAVVRVFAGSRNGTDHDRRSRPGSRPAHFDHQRWTHAHGSAPACRAPDARRSTSCAGLRTRGLRPARVHRWNVFDPGDAAKCACHGEGRRARNRALGEHADTRVSRRDGICRSENDGLDYRHRRDRPRREPARVHHRARDARAGAERSPSTGGSGRTCSKRRPSFPRSSRGRRRFRRSTIRATCGVSACASKARICRRRICRASVSASTATSSRSSMPRRLQPGRPTRSRAVPERPSLLSKATILTFAPRQKRPCAGSPARARARRR